MTVEVPRHEVLAQQFRYADLRFTQCIRCPTTVCWQTVRGGRDTGHVQIDRELGQ